VPVFHQGECSWCPPPWAGPGRGTHSLQARPPGPTLALTKIIEE
jgi:hypothetical protein